MNQTPAAILILTSSILAYAATAGTASFTTSEVGLAPQPTAIGFMLWLGSLVVGISGVVSLIAASTRDREITFDGQPRHDVFGMFDPRRISRPYAPMGSAVPPRAANEPSGFTLTPEMKAQLSMAAHLEGRERSAIIEDALRRYLPRYENSKAA